jgi:hypothetical protein
VALNPERWERHARTLCLDFPYRDLKHQDFGTITISGNLMTLEEG